MGLGELLRAGHSVKPHAHETSGAKPGATAVYYPLAGSRDAGGELIVEGEAIQPKDGMLVLFPTRTTHWVVEYTGSAPRISIAANLQELTEKQRRPGTPGPSTMKAQQQVLLRRPV